MIYHACRLACIFRASSCAPNDRSRIVIRRSTDGICLDDDHRLTSLRPAHADRQISSACSERPKKKEDGRRSFAADKGRRKRGDRRNFSSHTIPRIKRINRPSESPAENHQFHCSTKDLITFRANTLLDETIYQGRDISTMALESNV